MSNGRDALALIAAGGYDLVLMDCQMPVLDGLELVVTPEPVDLNVPAK